jgi:hypothetical protein
MLNPALMDPEEAPRAFVCPLSGRVMADPVISLADSLSYERAAWMERARVPGTLWAAVPNIALKAAISAWQERGQTSHGEWSA